MNSHAIPATFEDPHARRSDPSSSHIAVAAIAADAKLVEQIRHAARRLHPSLFDDTDLVQLVEDQTGRRQQRNVIARSRGLMEYAGEFVRVGVRKRDNRETMHYRLPHPGEQIEPTSHPVTTPTFLQLAMYRWCRTHAEPTLYADRCGHREPWDCVTTPLFIQE